MSWGPEFPTEWPRTRIKHVCRFAGGGTPDKGTPEYWNGDIPWVSPKDMKSSTIDDTEDHITLQGLEGSATKLVAPGAVLLVMRSGILRHSIPVAINRVPVALNQDMRAMTPAPRIEARYLARLLEAHQQQLLNAWSKVGSTVESLESDLVGDTDIAVPPLPRQRIIADYLDRETARLDALVAAKERVLGLLAEKRRALITRAVTRGLDPSAPLRDSGIPWFGEIPAHWEMVPFRWYFRIRSGDFLPSDDVATEADAVRRIQVIGGNGLAGYTDRSNVESTTVVIGRVGALCGNVHLVEGPAWITDNALLLTRVRSFVPAYLAYLLRELNLNSLANKTAQPLITGSMVAELRGPLPPYDEQRGVVEYISHEAAKLNAVRAVTERTITLLKERRAALIAAAVTGNIDVPPVPESVGCAPKETSC